MANPEDPILEYRKWKQHGESLRTQARQAMEVRFKELLTEAAQIAHDYQADFGGTLKPPPVVTAFRTKAGAKGSKPKAPVAVADHKQASANPVAGPKVAALERKLAAAKRKLEAVKAAGGATKTLEDKVYEIEDDLRLAQSVGG